jgi:hypothetical protein
MVREVLPDQKVFDLPVEPLVVRVREGAPIGKNPNRNPNSNFNKKKEAYRITYPGSKGGAYEEPAEGNLDRRV